MHWLTFGVALLVGFPFGVVSPRVGLDSSKSLYPMIAGHTEQTYGLRR
jgi:hypothetical protein